MISAAQRQLGAEVGLVQPEPGSASRHSMSVPELGSSAGRRGLCTRRRCRAPRTSGRHRGQALAHLALALPSYALRLVVLPRLYGYASNPRLLDLLVLAVPLILAVSLLEQLAGVLGDRRETAVVLRTMVRPHHAKPSPRATTRIWAARLMVARCTQKSRARFAALFRPEPRPSRIPKGSGPLKSQGRGHVRVEAGENSAGRAVGGMRHPCALAMAMILR